MLKRPPKNIDVMLMEPWVGLSRETKARTQHSGLIPAAEGVEHNGGRSGGVFRVGMLRSQHFLVDRQRPLEKRSRPIIVALRFKLVMKTWVGRIQATASSIRTARW
jgi:hypothetical protein